MIFTQRMAMAAPKEIVDLMEHREKDTDIITFCVGMGIRGPIAIGDYNVGYAKISVSYPQQINLGFGRIDLPEGLSTVFTVSWSDTNGRSAKRLRSKSFERNLPIYDAIGKINEIILAFKLVSIEKLDGLGLRTVGIGDTLFYFSKINDQYIGTPNLKMMLYGHSYYPRAAEKGIDPNDPHRITQLARPHIASDSHKVTRKYVRCYELLEHGFYTEAFIVAFSNLDDLVQQMLHRLLTDHGMDSETEQDEFLRCIKERRLRMYLGPLLKVLTGKDIFIMWPGSDRALDWLNRTRNRLAHTGEKADYATAAKGIFACVKTLIVLSQNHMMEADFTVEFFRHSKLTAAWTENAPDWVPSGSLAESMDFYS
jgi:hypothetical protein